MTRPVADWISAFQEYASYTEAPRRMHFWAGVSAVAGALRRKVWVDEYYYKWYPNFYIIFVAPPGIVSKSTTADIGIDLLRAIEDVKFGPDIVTWQALVSSFADAKMSFLYNDEYHPMSAVTVVAAELGNLLNPKDRDLVDLLITLWDNRKKIEKVTKMSGNDIVEAPWVNLIGCTTPSWILENVPPGMVGGGFTSRCVFVYADEKFKLVAHPGDHVPKDIEETKAKLVTGLEHISTMCGEFRRTKDATAWSEAWYKNLYSNRNQLIATEMFGNYIARKQTHMFKLAMVLSASKRDDLLLTADDLATADAMLTDIESDMPKVFEKIGKTEDAVQAERLINFIQKRGAVPYAEAYRFIHSYFPDLRDFEGIVSGAMRAGLIILEQVGADFVLKAPKIK